MSKKLKRKFSLGILTGIGLFIYASLRDEMITIPIEIGIGFIVVVLTSIFVDNINIPDDELKVEIWQIKSMYCAFLLIVMTFAVIAGDFMKKHM